MENSSRAASNGANFGLFGPQTPTNDTDELFRHFAHDFTVTCDGRGPPRGHHSRGSDNSRGRAHPLARPQFFSARNRPGTPTGALNDLTPYRPLPVTPGWAAAQPGSPCGYPSWAVPAHHAGTPDTPPSTPRRQSPKVVFGLSSTVRKVGLVRARRAHGDSSYEHHVPGCHSLSPDKTVFQRGYEVEQGMAEVVEDLISPCCSDRFRALTMHSPTCRPARRESPTYTKDGHEAIRRATVPAPTVGPDGELSEPIWRHVDFGEDTISDSDDENDTRPPLGPATALTGILGLGPMLQGPGPRRDAAAAPRGGYLQHHRRYDAKRRFSPKTRARARAR